MILPDIEADLKLNEPLTLESGQVLKSPTLRYAVYGRPTARNTYLVCHALSGSARVADWWPELFRDLFDLSKDAVIGVNILGSCYGSTGPRSIDPDTKRPYGSRFPLVSIRDIVRTQARVLDHLGIRKVQAVIGASIGGMQALQWAIDLPERVGRCVAIAASPLPAMGLALNHIQRQVILNDSNYCGGDYDEATPPVRGLALARALAMCSYKSAELFDERYGRQPNRNGEDPYRGGRFDVAGYLDYQGKIFNDRFNAASYIAITRAMDSFDPSRDYGSDTTAYSRIRCKVLLVGICSDWLFPARNVRELASRMRSAGVKVRYEELASTHGHDGFLADAHLLVPLLKRELTECRLAECA